MAAESSRMQGRNWCFTWNNPPTRDGDLQFTPEQLKLLTYYVVSLEQAPTTGTIHYQGFFQLVTRQRRSWVKKLMPKAHLIRCDGSPDQNETYCTKENTHIAGPWRWGALTGGQGRRMDLEELGQSIVAGKKVADVAFTQPEAVIRYGRGLRQLQELVDTRAAKEAHRDPYVYVLWGAAGTGKTSLPHSLYPERSIYTFHLTPGGHLWFDGYEGEPVLIIDDFSGWIPFRTLLVWLDRYPCRLEIKGGHTYARWERVFITSNVPPESWYVSQDQEPLARRINYVWHFPDDVEIARQVVAGTLYTPDTP